MFPSHTSVGYVEGPGFRAAEVSKIICTPIGVLKVSHLAVEVEADGFCYFEDDDDDDD